MAKKDKLPGSDLLPTVAEPGTFEWCEEVVECMNAAWRTRETAERGFLAAVRAAVEYRIWETLSPPLPGEPIISLDGLIRRTADAGQAENMQIAIRFSGVLNEGEVRERPAHEPGDQEPEERPAIAAGAPGRSHLSVPLAGAGGAERPAGRLTEEEEIAAGNALLDRYASELTAIRLDSAEEAAQLEKAAADTAAAPRRTATQRKRDKLVRTHPELAEAVDAGEMTLKQAYVEAGIEKEVKTLDRLQRLWRSASEEERDHFLSWLETEEQVEARRAYEREVYGENE